MNTIINYIKNKLLLILLILVLILSIFGYVTYQRASKLDSEKTLAVNNFFNSQFKLDSIITKNGETTYKTNALQLKVDDLQKFNSKLTDKINSLNIKLNNVQSTVMIDTRLEYRIDTVKVNKLSDTTFKASYKDKWLSLTQNITLIDSCKNIQVDSLQITSKDSMYIISEIIKERWTKWYKFWKVPVGIKTNVMSDNPHLKVNKIESYQVIQ